MHSKKDDPAKAGKGTGRSAAVPVITVDAKPAPGDLTAASKPAVKKTTAVAAAGHDEKEYKSLLSQSRILQASHPGFSQISQSSTPISSTPRPLSAVPHAAVSSKPHSQSEYGTWTLGERVASERPREADRPRKNDDEKLHKLCQLVTVTSGMVSRQDLDDLLLKMLLYIPTKTVLELVQKQVQADPRRKRNVETILQTFVDEHALFSHHERGTSSSPFDPKNVHSSHSHEVDSISRGKPMTSQGDLPQRPAHPQAGLRRSGEFERGHLQSHRANSGEHNFAQTHPANAAMSSSSASESHHIRGPSFDNGRCKDEQLFAFDHEQGSDHDASSEGGLDHTEDENKEELACGSPAHVHLTGQPFFHQQRFVQPVPALNFANLNSSKSHDSHQRSVFAGPVFQQSTISAQNEEDSGSLSARSNGSASIGKGPSAFSPRGALSPRVSPLDAPMRATSATGWGSARN